MAKVLIDIDKVEDFDYFKQTNICRANMCRAIKNGIVLDGLTNGEVIQKMFPYAEVEAGEYWVFVDLPCESYEFFRLNFPIDWWNAKWGE